MKNAANVKYVLVTPPAALVDNAAFTTGAVDRKGFDHVTFVVSFGAIDVNVASSKIRHSDASDMSSSADIAVGGTDYALGTAASSDNKVHAIDVDLVGRKRYIDFEITGGDGSTGTYASVLAILSRPSKSPASVTDRGVEVYGSF